MNDSQHIKSPASVILYGIMLSSTALFFGYSVGIFNGFFKDFIIQVYNINSEKEQDSIKSDLNLYFLIGGTVACIISSFLIELLGRYKFLLLISAGQVLAGCLLTIKSFFILYSCRLLCGFCACASTFICPLMIKEIIPERYSAQISASFYIFLTGGILISNLMSAPGMTAYWQLILSLPSILEVPKLIAYLFNYRSESPRTILARHPNPETALYQNFLNIYTEEGSRLETQKVLKERDNSQSSSKKIALSSLFTREYRLAFFLGLLLNFLNQATGINFLVLYSTDIFTKLDLPKPKLLTQILGFLNFSGAIYITFFGKNHGKRSLLIFGIGMQALALFIFLVGLLLQFGPLVLAGCFLYISFFSVSLGGTLYGYLADTVPAVGISFAGITQWLLACFVGKFALDVMKHFGEFNTFYFFMIVAFFGCILFTGFSVDTEGKTDTQIQTAFRKKRFMD